MFCRTRLLHSVEKTRGVARSTHPKATLFCSTSVNEEKPEIGTESAEEANLLSDRARKSHRDLLRYWLHYSSKKVIKWAEIIYNLTALQSITYCQNWSGLNHFSICHLLVFPAIRPVLGENICYPVIRSSLSQMSRAIQRRWRCSGLKYYPVNRVRVSFGARVRRTLPSEYARTIRN